LPLPDLPVITPEALQVIATKHHARYVEKLPEQGMFNGVFALGDDLILRVPRNNPFPISKTYKEQVAVSAARAVGVRTPAIVTFDDSLELIAAPYAVYERVRGETLEPLGLEPYEAPEVWRELGRDFARLHHGIERQGQLSEVESPSYPDPRVLADNLAEKGYFTVLEAHWLQAWLEQLAPAVQTPIEPRFLHGDPQGTNVMVGGAEVRYLAVLDWGSAKWGDPAWDFVNIPFSAVPFMLEGYRELAPLAGDE
jgi:aminoglycoside phosphotransferase (APT) family kinase protein